jgi:hypothetical protein
VPGHQALAPPAKALGRGDHVRRAVGRCFISRSAILGFLEAFGG